MYAHCQCVWGKRRFFFGGGGRGGWLKRLGFCVPFWCGRIARYACKWNRFGERENKKRFLFSTVPLKKKKKENQLYLDFLFCCCWLFINHRWTELSCFPFLIVSAPWCPCLALHSSSFTATFPSPLVFSPYSKASLSLLPLISHSIQSKTTCLTSPLTAHRPVSYIITVVVVSLSVQ